MKDYPMGHYIIYIISLIFYVTKTFYSIYLMITKEILFVKNISTFGSEYNNSLRYLAKKEYNENLTANEKRALRKCVESFILKENMMYYRVGEGEFLTSFTCS